MYGFFVSFSLAICALYGGVDGYHFQNLHTVLRQPLKVQNSLRHSVALQQVAASASVPHVASESIQIIEPFGKGLKEDLNRKLPLYFSDIKDGFRVKTLSSTFFLFFACLAPAVAFGGLLALATGGMMGTVEAVGATAIGGVLYAMFSGQPLTIIGTTGPLLAFLKVLYEACKSRGIPFLTMYAWVGLWSSFFLFLSAFFSTSNLVEYFTKFTDDIFSTLISVIFIYEAVKELYLNFSNPVIAGIQAASSLIVALTTFFVASTLSKLRKTPFFPRKVRDTLSDFAPTIGVLSGIQVARAAMAKYQFSLPMLAVPEVLATTSGRPWLVDLFCVSNQVKLLAVLPALMATVLLFMDQNITVRLIMSKQNKLKKGSGIHLDMLVVAVVTTITSLLGMPWMVAATVRSLAHLRSLKEYRTVEEKEEEEVTTTTTTTTESKVEEVKGPQLEMTGVVEQRVSGLMIHTLIGAAVLFCRPLLRMIPVSVLTGLFLYLGISSIGTTDFFQRSLLFLADPADAPRSQWIKVAGLKRTKLFTAVQLLLLSSMWWIKGTALGVFFPVLIGLLAPVRIALEKFNLFTKKELDVLDGEIE